MENQKQRLDKIEKRTGIRETLPVQDISELKWITKDEEDEWLSSTSSKELVDLIDAMDKGQPLPRILEWEDPVCARKIMDEEDFGVTLSVLIENEEPKYPEKRFVQIQHPNTGEWCLIDRDKARITERREKKFKEVPIIKVKGN